MIQEELICSLAENRVEGKVTVKYWKWKEKIEYLDKPSFKFQESYKKLLEN